MADWIGVDVEEATVACGCGRKMTLDALRGRGAYRCGCGARIQISIESRDENRCAAAGCRMLPVAELTTVKLCAEHQESLILECAPLQARYPIGSWVQAGGEYRRRFGEIKPCPPEPVTRVHDPIVYFIAVNGRVKIGTTTNLPDRLSKLSLPPDAAVILKLEGSYGLEKRMHAQFADERLGGSEWFTLSPRIQEFVAQSKLSGSTRARR